jgi:hypothetical protein
MIEFHLTGKFEASSISSIGSRSAQEAHGWGAAASMGAVPGDRARNLPKYSISPHEIHDSPYLFSSQVRVILVLWGSIVR